MHFNNPTTITIEAAPPRLNDVDFANKELPDKKTYHKHLKKLQKDMLKIQQAYFHDGRRAMVVLEGWDAGGKGGVIRRLTEGLDPRGFTVHPIGAPRREDQEKHYLYRFYQRLPPAGTIGIFDRSWYGRVLVERIEEFAKPAEWQRAYQEINEFERMLSDDGVRIVKFFMHITKDEQLKRFEQRLADPDKRWKLTEEDIRNRERWADYEAAINEMFARTSSELAPWHLIAANRKWYARIEVMKTVADTLKKGVSLKPPPVDPELIKDAKNKLGIRLDKLG